MSEGPPQRESGGQMAAADWEEAGFPVEQVRELFVTFTKALRAFQLYDRNNPVYQRFVSSLRDAFRSLWDEMDRLTVVVREEALVCAGVEVYREAKRSDSLAFLLYKDGVREVAFLPGLEDFELERLLAVLQRARNLRHEEDDLLTILWEAELEYFRHSYVDLLAEGVEMPEEGEGAEAGTLQSVLEGELGELREELGVGEEEEGSALEAAATISAEDFNPTLYSLDAKEIEKLQAAVDREMERDLRADVLAALFDRVEEPWNAERQLEILSIFRTLLPNLLSHGALEAAASVLKELRALLRKEEGLDDDGRRRVESILTEVSAPAAIGELVRALEDGSLQPTPQELAGFLRNLRAGALEPLLRASELTEVKEIQPILREAVKGIARTNRDAVVALLESSDTVVVSAAVRLVGRMQVAGAAQAVADLLAHEDARVRLAAVEAARDLKAPSATGALPPALDDPDRDVRIAASRALGDLRYEPAADRFRELIEGKEIRQADITEKVALFEGYGRLGDPGAVDLLDGLLNGKGFLGRKEPPEIRAAAALGLGKVGTPAAREALEKAREEEDPVIRSAVSRALKGGE